jgi:hypothetical protein
MFCILKVQLVLGTLLLIVLRISRLMIWFSLKMHWLRWLTGTVNGLSMPTTLSMSQVKAMEASTYHIFLGKSTTTT